MDGDDDSQITILTCKRTSVNFPIVVLVSHMFSSKLSHLQQVPGNEAIYHY